MSGVCQKDAFKSILNGDLPTMEAYLSQEGVDVNQQNSEGESLLSLAVKHNRLALVPKLCRDFAADLSSHFFLDQSKFLFGISYHSSTVLGIAIVEGHTEMTALLLELGAELRGVAYSPTGSQDSAFAVALSVGNFEIMKLVQARDPELAFGSFDDYGDYTWFAAEMGSLEMLKWFHEKGYQLVDNLGQTPMHYAAKSGSVAILEWLHKTRPDINLTTGEGPADDEPAGIDSPPIEVALSAGKLEVVMWLQNHGVDTVECWLGSANPFNISWEIYEYLQGQEGFPIELENYHELLISSDSELISADNADLFSGFISQLPDQQALIRRSILSHYLALALQHGAFKILACLFDQCGMSATNSYNGRLLHNLVDYPLPRMRMRKCASVIIRHGVSPYVLNEHEQNVFDKVISTIDCLGDDGDAEVASNLRWQYTIVNDLLELSGSHLSGKVAQILKQKAEGHQRAYSSDLVELCRNNIVEVFGVACHIGHYRTAQRMAFLQVLKTAWCRDRGKPAELGQIEPHVRRSSNLARTLSFVQACRPADVKAPVVPEKYTLPDTVGKLVTLFLGDSGEAKHLISDPAPELMAGS